jgi:branched-chain amino acid transport system permease protein
MMNALRNFNLRDKGAEIWAGWSRPVRTAFVLTMILIVGLLPFSAEWGPTSFLNTPITSFQNVLVYPVGMFILMALGLNIVVGKSGLLDLGFVAFFAIGAYSQAIL